MSFNKGFINESKIKRYYDKGGIKRVTKMFRSYDAYIIEDDYSDEAIKLFNKGKLKDFFKEN